MLGVIISIINIGNVIIFINISDILKVIFSHFIIDCQFYLCVLIIFFSKGVLTCFNTYIHTYTVALSPTGGSRQQGGEFQGFTPFHSPSLVT